MCGSCFLTHSASLCLFIGAFKPFIFKLIIDRYVFITILFFNHFLFFFFFFFLKQAL